MSVLGMVLIGLAVGFYDETFRAPGPMSLLPVMGACLLLLASEDAFINRTLLSWRVMTFIGLISYSLYLWHWPLLSYFSLIVPVHSSWATLCVLGLSFPIASAVYYFIETPARRTKVGGRIFVPALCVVLIGCVVVGQVIKRCEGFANRPIAVELGRILDTTDPTSIPLQTTVVNGIKLPTTQQGVTPDILFVGDSHVAQYVPRLKVLSKESGIQVGVLTYLGCFAVPQIKAVRNNQQCERIVEQYLTLLENPDIKKVVFGGIWGRYLHQRGEYMLSDANGTLHELADDGFEIGIRHLKKLIEKYPEKQFYVLLDYPWSENSYSALANINRLTKEWARKNEFYVPYPSLNHWKEGNERVKLELNGLVTFVDAEDGVCQNKRCNMLFYRDGDHLRASFVQDKAVWLDPIFK